MTQHQGEAKEGSVYPGLRVQSFQSIMVEQRGSPFEGQEGRGNKKEKERRRIWLYLMDFWSSPLVAFVLWILDIIQPLTLGKIMIINFWVMG